ncbi:hypothetical protein B0H11DRAFT_2075616, partial [Mycena galericulata]
LRHLDHAKLRTLLPTASEAETIEYKRRLNTLAARKSRERKLEDVQALSTLIDLDRIGIPVCGIFVSRAKHVCIFI